jgi:hypothetical protein
MAGSGHGVPRALAKPELLYTVEYGPTGWTACCEDQRYGPYSTLSEAIASAISEATEAGRLGFDSVIVASGRGGYPQ